MIIGVSGKKQHGKDTVAKMIQELTKSEEQDSHWEKKQLSYKLKQIVALLINCTVEQLENNDFKEKPLDKGWELYFVAHCIGRVSNLHLTIAEAVEEQVELSTELGISETYIQHYIPTPRRLLQLLGTDAGRDIIHPNIWVNALMSEYNEQKHRTCLNCMHSFNYEEAHYPEPDNGRLFLCPKCKSLNHASVLLENSSNWIVTDVRFPNEAKAIKDKNGLLIRVNNGNIVSTDNHTSETALDNYQEFDIIINNDYNLDYLKTKVVDFLIQHKIIT